MSDPVSSMDVEDVLSSIRRLVSEEAKTQVDTRSDDSADNRQRKQPGMSGGAEEASSDMPADRDGAGDDGAGPGPANDAPAVTPDEVPRHVSFRHQAAAARRGRDEKLVLTSAFRVTEPPVTRPEPDPESRTEPPLSGGASVPRPPLQAVHPHLRPVGDDHFANRDLRQPDSHDKTPDEIRGVTGPDHVDGADAQDGSPATDAGSQARPFRYAPEDTLFARAQKAMEAVREKDNEGHSGISSDDDGQAPQAPSTAADPDADTGQNAPDTWQDATSGNSRPDESDSAGRAGDPLNEPDEEISTINFAEEEETILDEEMLRDLVSEMVREELQGELGDRITRNVRKLVRREIQRALASREFE